MRVTSRPGGVHGWFSEQIGGFAIIMNFGRNFYAAAQSRIRPQCSTAMPRLAVVERLRCAAKTAVPDRYGHDAIMRQIHNRLAFANALFLNWVTV